MCKRFGLKDFCVAFGILSLIVLVSIPNFAFAGNKIYMVKQKNGTIKYTSQSATKVKRPKIFKSTKRGFTWYKMTGNTVSNSKKKKGRSKLFKQKYTGIIQTAASRYNIDRALLKAVIHVESAFNPKAVSPKGAVGLMQIMPFNFRSLGVKNPFEPLDNVSGGAKLLSKLHKRYKGDIRLALAAYNAGEGAVAKYNGIPPYRETQNYVKKVIEYQKKYQQLFS